MSSNDYDYYCQPVKLTMELQGNGTVDSFDLRAFSILMFNFITAVDNTHCVLAKQERLSNEKRNELQIHATDIARGSIHIDFDLVIAAAQMIAPLLGWVNPYSIWQYTVQSYNFLKAAGKSMRKGVTPNVQITESPGALTILGNENLIVVDSGIAAAAARNQEVYRILSDEMEQEGISSMRIKPRDNKDEFDHFELSYEDKGIFSNSSFVDENPTTFDANILSLDKERLSGRLHTLAAQSIPEGTYSFKAIGDQDQAIYINALSKTQVKIIGLTENVLDNVSGLKIKRIQIIKILLPESEKN